MLNASRCSPVYYQDQRELLVNQLSQTRGDLREQVRKYNELEVSQRLCTEMKRALKMTELDLDWIGTVQGEWVNESMPRHLARHHRTHLDALR